MIKDEIKLVKSVPLFAPLQDCKQQVMKRNLLLSRSHPPKDEAPPEEIPPLSPRLGRPIKRIKKTKMAKANSTSSLFVNLVPHSADSSVLVQCLSKAVYRQVFHNRYLAHTRDIWNEKLHPLEDDYINFDFPPSPSQVENLISRIFLNQILSAECAVMAAAYIDRIALRKVKLYPANWRRVLLGALLMAEKVWEDQAVWNVDYTKSFPHLSVEDIRQLEREFLIKIQFELTLRPSEYAKYYFWLVALRDRTPENYPIKPLDKKTAQLLEAKSKGLTEEEKKNHDRPSKSIDWGQGSQGAVGGVSLEQLHRIRKNT